MATVTTSTTTTGENFVAIATFLLVAATSYGGVSAQVSPPAPLPQAYFAAPTATITVYANPPDAGSTGPSPPPPSPQNSPSPTSGIGEGASKNPPSIVPTSSPSGLTVGAIAGICVGILAGLLVVAVSIYYIKYKKRNNEASGNAERQTSGSGGPSSAGDAVIPGFTVDKSVEFSYEELANATNDFSSANKIGQGGFGAVYYAELRDERAAIKKMDMQASREFLAELHVLTRVHHHNLVRLIGYCVEGGSLFLVYEYIDNGNLSQHLHGSGSDPLPWSSRVQIALDSARALEYIHEHTVPVYIHRDIKSANILIDKNLHGKILDCEVGSSSLLTARLMGTFGYMSPEYAQYGRVSPKIDVYAFGVVLYELISAKEAILKINESFADAKGLITLFDEVLNKDNPKEDLRKLVDPRLGDNYPIDSAYKMAQLAKACTQENPQQRPSMKYIVVALMMTLSSNTGDSDVGSLYENKVLMNLMSGR